MIKCMSTVCLKGAVLLIFSLILIHKASAQLDNSFFYDEYSIDTADNSSLRIGADLTPLIKNNEYFNNIIEGYTLFGYQFKPYLSLYPSENVRIDAGGYFMKEFGGRGFHQVKPYLAIKYKLGHFSMVFGDIEGTLTHRLTEPMYDFERIITNRMEEGLQFKWTSSKLFIDTWLNWENFIHMNDPGQEIFNSGLSFRYRLINTDRFVLSVPVQFLARHHGGQINVSSAPVYTVFNSCAGLSVNLPASRDGFFRSVEFDGYYLGSSAPDVSVVPYARGNGILAYARASFRYFTIDVSYWRGRKFYSPIGTPMYQSAAVEYPLNSYREPDRQLLFMRLYYETKLSGKLSLAFRFEPVYDLNNHHWDHSESLYLRFNTDWRLLKL